MSSNHPMGSTSPAQNSKLWINRIEGSTCTRLEHFVTIAVFSSVATGILADTVGSSTSSGATAVVWITLDSWAECSVSFFVVDWCTTRFEVKVNFVLLDSCGIFLTILDPFFAVCIPWCCWWTVRICLVRPPLEAKPLPQCLHFRRTVGTALPDCESRALLSSLWAPWCRRPIAGAVVCELEDAILGTPVTWIGRFCVNCGTFGVACILWTASTGFAEPAVPDEGVVVNIVVWGATGLDADCGMDFALFWSSVLSIPQIGFCRGVSLHCYRCGVVINEAHSDKS